MSGAPTLESRIFGRYQFQKRTRCGQPRHSKTRRHALATFGPHVFKGSAGQHPGSLAIPLLTTDGQRRGDSWSRGPGAHVAVGPRRGRVGPAPTATRLFVFARPLQRSATPFSAWPVPGFSREKVWARCDQRANSQLAASSSTVSIPTPAMATNSIKLLTGNSYPELARLVADRYVQVLV